MTHPALEAILDDLRRQPSRTPSVVVTVFGDAILPRGGSVWLGTLTAFFAAIGIQEGAVRTATSRLTAEGWLARERFGRNSFYRLAEKGRATFEAATHHIYDPRPAPFDGRLTLLLVGAEMGVPDPPRVALEAAGFGNLSPNLWVAPGDVAVPEGSAGALRLEARAEAAEAARLARQAWRLDRVADGYRRFVAVIRPLRAAIAEGAALTELDAFVARILLIHAFRRVVLRDPELPPDLLPADWPGQEARRLCGELYGSLLPASERWLDQHGLAENGPLPSAATDLRTRFGSNALRNELT